MCLGWSIALLMYVTGLQNVWGCSNLDTTAGGEDGAPERGEPPEGGVGDAPDHSSSTCWRLGKRGV